MKLRFFWSLFLLLLLAFPSFAAVGMDPIPRDLLKDNNGVLAVDNMPKTRSQDSFGICYSFVASTLLDEAYCVKNKIADCASAGDDKRFSALDVARYGSKLPEGMSDMDRESFVGINEGGSAALTIQRSLGKASIKEECAPFNQIVSKVNDPLQAQKLETSTWSAFKDSYDTYIKKTKECADCGLEYATAKSQELKDKFNLKASNQDILEAFSQETYATFLDRLLVPDKCLDVKNMLFLDGDWDLKQFPTEKKANYDSTILKIKEVLSKKRPIAFSFCAQDKVTVKSLKACGEIKDKNGNTVGAGHGVVIKGYRKVCRSAGDCYEALQVQNSWGEGWQNANSDGWVDAKVLLDRSFYELGALTWLEQETK